MLPANFSFGNRARASSDILPHIFQCVFFEAGNLSLADRNFLCHLHLRFPLKKPHLENMPLSGSQLIHRFGKGDIFNPALISILRILYLIHDKDCIPIIMEYRLIQRNRLLNGIQGQYHIFSRHLNIRSNFRNGRLSGKSIRKPLFCLQGFVGNIPQGKYLRTSPIIIGTA